MIKSYRPVKTDRHTQGFGENNACAKVSAPGVAVQPYMIVNQVNGVCPIGYDSLYHLLGTKGHAGDDFAGYWREPIHFDIDTGDQKVEWEAINIYSPTAGQGVLIRSLQPVKLDQLPPMSGAQFKMVENEYNRFDGAVHLMRYYGHMQSTNITTDRQRVKKGDLVGYMGDSGATTGVHTHRYLAVCGANDEGPFFLKDTDSDFAGRIKENAFMVNQFVLDVAPEANENSKMIELLTSKRDLLQVVVSLYQKLIALKSK